MSSTATFATNLLASAHNGDTVTIAGGNFSPRECREAANHIVAAAGLCAALQALQYQLRDTIRFDVKKHFSLIPVTEKGVS